MDLESDLRFLNVMWFFPPLFRNCRTRRRAGVRSQALVITLALVALASILVAAFFSMVSLDRDASASYTQSLKAEQLGLGSLQMLIGQLQSEMSKESPPDTGTPVGTYSNSPIYTNVTSANILPQPAGTNSTMPALLKISCTTNFYQGTNLVTHAVTTGLQATTISSTAPSLNGRSVTLNRWNQAYMGVFPNNAAAPNWLLITRGGPTNAVGVAPSYFGATGNTLNNPTYANPNYVVGRIAYAVYDEGSLLDITVAGYPSSLANFPSELAQTKGTLAGLSLPNALGISSSQSDTLINWRNAASAAGGNPTNFASYAQTNGFQTVYPGDTTFLSRQDLIQAAKKTSTTGIGTAMLTNLATFTREVNAPSWGPSTPTGSTVNYATIANTAGSPNRFLPLVRSSATGTITDFLDDGSTTTYPINQGDPIIQRRFSLARLKWLGPNGPQNGGTAANILACFGLAWQPSADTDLATENSGTAPHVWAYVGSTATGSPLPEAATIETLDQVAKEGRQPNFFELLQAGILSGSLGVNMTGSAAFPSFHQSGAPGVTLQILRIGADIINQYGSYTNVSGGNSMFYPVVIEFQRSASSNWRACGVENLPNVSSMATVMGDYGSEPPVPITLATMPTSSIAAVYLMFGLWNPNQLSADSPNAGNIPPPVRLHVKGSYAVASFWGTTTQLPVASVPGTSTAAGPSAGYELTSPQIDVSIPLLATAAVQGSKNGAYGFANSSVLTTADVTAPLRSTAPPSISNPNPAGVFAQTLPMGMEGRGDLVGLRLPDFPFSVGANSAAYPTAPPNYYTTGVSICYGLVTGQPFNAFMEFQDPSGAWIPYQFFTGMNDIGTWITNLIASAGSNLTSTPFQNAGSPAPPALVAPQSTRFLNYVAPLFTGAAHYINGRYGLGVGPSIMDAVPGTGNVDFWGTWDYPYLYLSNDPRSMRFNAWMFDASGHSTSGYYNPPADSVQYAGEHSDLWVPNISATATAPYPGAVVWPSPSVLTEGFGGVSGYINYQPALFGSSYFPTQFARNNSNNSGAYLAGNNTASSSTWSSYLDGDKILRIGDSGYFTDTSAATGNPFYQNPASGGRIADQPIILRRPFNSVAEMGYAFRDDPWRSLDFFSGKSADAALLDLFSLYATPQGVVHGRVDLNTRNPLLIQSVLSGTVDDVMKTNIISATAATSVAAAYTANVATTPFVNKADLTTKFIGTSSFSGTAGFSPDEQMVKPQREATARALADIGETRTWNLMIDLVAQVGKYPATATGLDQFVVEGERHYWLHIAIDRFTGKVVDQQLEVVTQ